MPHPRVLGAAASRRDCFDLDLVRPGFRHLVRRQDVVRRDRIGVAGDESVVVGVTRRTVIIEPDRCEGRLVDRRDMTRLALVQAGVGGLDDVPVVVESQPEASLDRGGDRGEFRMPVQRAKEVALRALPVVDRRKFPFTPAMVRVALHAGDLLGRVRFQRAGAAKQHVPGIGQPLRAADVVTALASQVHHAAADQPRRVTLRALEVNRCVLGRDVARGDEPRGTHEVESRQPEQQDHAGQSRERPASRRGGGEDVALRARRRAGREDASHRMISGHV